MPSRIVAVWCWYHGGPFRGYQSQPLGPTIQDELIRALRAAGFERNPAPSGRTDLGVHARMQVLSFRVVEGVPPEEVASRLNPHLPRGLGVALSRRAARDFHAAWRATGKEYRYRIALADDARLAPYSWRTDVRPERLADVLARVPGTRDFFAFHDKSSTVKPRTVRTIEVAERPGGLVDIRLVGDGFARYMVRFLVGAAVGVARGEISDEAFTAALDEAKVIAPSAGENPSDRRAQVKAPAKGLVLWEVHYPREVDPFTAEERRLAPGVPGEPPFT